MSEKFDKLYEGLKYGEAGPDGEPIERFLAVLSEDMYKVDRLTECVQSIVSHWHIDNDQDHLHRHLEELEDQEDELYWKVDEFVADKHRMLQGSKGT